MDILRPCKNPVLPTKYLHVVTLEGLESLQGNSGGSRDELQQPGSALLVEGLHRFPEPFDDVAVWGAVFEPRVGLPVVDVDFAESAYDQLQGKRKSRERVGPCKRDTYT